MRAPSPPLTRRRRLLVLATCCLSLFVVGIDAMAVNLALPSIRAQLGASPTQLQWVVDAYVLVLASLLLLSGSVADRFGRRRVFQLGLVVFGLGSLLCSLATSPGALIVSRALQAVGGSMLNPVAMSIITNTFDDPQERAEAIGIWGGTVGLSMATGPLVGGFLVDAVGWQAIFWINIPVVLTAAVLAAILVPESRAARPRRFDPVGQALLVGLLGGATFAIIEGRVLGWGSPVVLGCLLGALGCGMLFVRHAARVAHPVLDPAFFRNRSFSFAVLAAILGFSAMSGFLFLNTLYLQEVRGYTPLAAGLLTVPMAGMTALCSPVSGVVVGRRGSRGPLVLAGLGIGACGVLLSRLAPDTSVWVVVAAYLCFGTGFGTVNAPVTYAAVSGMPRSQAGVAAAVASTSRQVGAALGVAVFGAVTFAALGEQSMAGSFAAATHLAWWLMVGCGAGLVTLGLRTPRGPLAPTLD
ncbi:MAG TPA: MFS transporter [Dermatophilaceae bacterium]|nr:MFS transporter [Dermatophilaceae bacterium]